VNCALLVAIQTHHTFPAFLPSVEITGTALSVAG